jgi:GT2 family glycosyltransferase
MQGFDARIHGHYNGHAWPGKTACLAVNMHQPLVYVVILNWNLKDDTAECVASVLNSDYSNYRLLVVDNGSDDGSPQHLRHSFAGIEVMVNPANLGFAAGNNVGIRRALGAGADYVLLLNNDTTVDTAMLGRLVTCAEGADQIGLVSPKILYHEARNRIWRLGDRAHRWLPVPVPIGRDQLDQGQFAAAFDVDYVPFCGVLIKRTLLETIGLLDERFFFTYEDADFCRRSRDVGYRIVCQPQARMWHKVSLSAQKAPAKICYLKSKSRAVFYRRYRHGLHPWLTATYLWLSTLGAAVASALRGDVHLARLALRGLYDGYRERLEVS